MAGPYEIGQAVLLVNSPSAAPGYDSARMMYVRQPGMLESFTQSAWVDTPARMLTPLLVQSLQRSGQFRAVLAAPSAALADLRLEIAIVRLQHDFLQLPSQVLLSLRGTLVDNSSREVLAWHTFDVRENAPSNDAGGGAAAARAAVQAALLALVQWLKPLAAQPRAID
jgi:cholesterol transport system auxiliary component